MRLKHLDSDYPAQGDVLTEIDSLLFQHEKQAARQENLLNVGFWLSLPALGLAQFALARGNFKCSEFGATSVYCSAEFFIDPRTDDEYA